MYYRQFVLERTTETGFVTTTCWLPEKHRSHVLQEGDQLTLAGTPGEWWTVLTVSEQSRTPEEIQAHRRAQQNFGKPGKDSHEA